MQAKAPPLTAVRVAAPLAVHYPDGREGHAAVGDWLITSGRQVVDVCGAARFADRYTILDPNDRRLPAATRVRLEETLGVGATRSDAELVAAVERLAHLSIGTVKIDFTPGQLEEISFRARKRGWTIEQALRAVVDRIKEEIFWRS